MNETPTKLACFPNGENVKVSLRHAPWWDEHGATGFVSPEQLAPDPDQPRVHMHDSDLQELTSSVRECGVREHIIVTPRDKAPWATVADEHRDAYFVIVSGHRRRQAALNTKLKAVPITIRLYGTPESFRIDQFVLNATRSDLTPLEEGWYFEKCKKRVINPLKLAE